MSMRNTLGSFAVLLKEKVFHSLCVLCGYKQQMHLPFILLQNIGTYGLNSDLFLHFKSPIIIFNSRLFMLFKQK